jgi:hypothetical protein
MKVDQTFLAPDNETQGVGVVTADPAGALGTLIGARQAAEFMLSFADLTAIGSG